MESTSTRDVTHTVDGSEILRSPVEGTVVYPIIHKVLATSQVVVEDFFHQQYVLGIIDCFNCRKLILAKAWGKAPFGSGLGVAVAYTWPA